MLLTNQLVEDVLTGGVVTTVLHHSQVQLVPRNLLSLHMLEEGLSPTLSTPIYIFYYWNMRFCSEIKFSGGKVALLADGAAVVQVVQ